MKKLIFLLIGFIIFVGCEDDSNPVLPDLPPSISKRALEAAPETLKVAGQSIFLSTYLWRDFMPISPPDGKPLIVLSYIQTIDSTDISDEIDANAIYVIKGNDIWRAYFEDDESNDPYSNPKQLVKVARDGPKWETEIFVNVVVNILYRGKNYLLKAEDQFISETW